MIVDLTQEELWKIQEYVREVDGEHTHLYWDYEWMHEVHRGIMYLVGNTEASTYDLCIEDTDFWWLVVQQIPAGLMVGADKEFGRKLLKKVMVQLKVPVDHDVIGDVFKDAFDNDDGILAKI